MTEFMSYDDSPDGDESVQIAEILRGYGQEHGFDADACDEIAALPFQEAFETAHRLLFLAGLNADGILVSFMVEPPEIYLM